METSAIKSIYEKELVKGQERRRKGILKKTELFNFDIIAK